MLFSISDLKSVIFSGMHVERAPMSINRRVENLKKAAVFHEISNQSHICGEGVGLGLFPSNSFESQPYNFEERAHIKTLYGIERLHKTSFKP